MEIKKKKNIQNKRGLTGVKSLSHEKQKKIAAVGVRACVRVCVVEKKEGKPPLRGKGSIYFLVK